MAIKKLQISHTLFLRLMFVLLFIVSCSQNPSNRDISNRVRQAEYELDMATALNDTKSKTKSVESLPDWPSVDRDTTYVYVKEMAIYGRESNYDNLTENLRTKVIRKISESISVDIQSVYHHTLGEDDGQLTDYFNRITKITTQNTFRGKELEIRVYPANDQDLKIGDQIVVWGRLNHKEHRARLEKEKLKNISAAKSAFSDAIKTFESGQLSSCLNNIIRCKYYVDKGGGHEGVLHYKDQTRGYKPLITQLDEFIIDLRSSIELTLNNFTETAVRFNRNDRKKLIEIRLISRINDFDLSGIEINVQSEKTGKSIPPTGKNYTNPSGILVYSVKDLLNEIDKDILQITFNNKPSSMMKDDPSWFKSKEYSDFMKLIGFTTIPISILEFQPLKTMLVVTKDSSIDFNTTEFENSVEDILVGESEYFSILQQEAGMGKNELQEIIQNKKTLDKQELDKLSQIDLILNLQVESTSQYKIRLTMLTVDDNHKFKKIGVSSVDVSNKTILESSGSSMIVNRFLDDYFRKSLDIAFNHPVVCSIEINNKRISVVSDPVSRISEIPISRHHNQHIEITYNKYRTTINDIAPNKQELFKYDEPNRKLRTKDDRIIRLNPQLVNKQGTLQISVYDNQNHLLDQDGWQKTKIDLYVKKWFFIKNKVESSLGTSKKTFALNNLGKYNVEVSHPGYAKPLSQSILIQDDLEIENEQSLTFYLRRKSMVKAIVYNSALPGAGQYYLDKPLYQSVVPATLYSLSVLASIKYYIDFQNSKDNFLLHQDRYYSDNFSQSKILHERDLARSYYKSMTHNKKMIEYSIISAILSNILTNGLLWVQESYDL